MFKRLKKLKDDFVSVATNSAGPADFQLGSTNHGLRLALLSSNDESRGSGLP
jgi:hypothetical protein